MLRANDVARYFLGMVDKDNGDNITQLKLQKLLYYAQGLYVAMNDGEPLFEDPIEAWELGPVVKSVYDETKVNGAQPIECPAGFDRTDYPPEIQEFLDAVMYVYGQYSAWKLSEMTHREPPWREAWERCRNADITIPSLHDFFRSVVEAGRRHEAVQGEPVWPTDSFHFRHRAESSRRLEPYRQRLKEIARSVPEPAIVIDDDEDW